MKGEFIMTLKEEYQQRLNEYEALKRTSHAHLWIDQVCGTISDLRQPLLCRR